jgi:site-specific DNA-methyltransferase (adenine-specific)
MSKSEAILIDTMEYMKTIPDKHFYIVMCDVPYGINVTEMAFTKENKKVVIQKNGTKLNPFTHKKKYIMSQWDLETPTQEYFDELCRITQHQIIFGVEYVNWTGLGPGRIKWNKMVPEALSFKGYELAYCSFINHTHEINLLWSGMQQGVNAAFPTKLQGNKKLNEKRIHPCHKPIMLYDKITMDFNLQNKSVFDSHLGSGSSRISAHKHNQPFVGTEIDPAHFKDQEERWTEYTTNLKKFPNLFNQI